MISYKVLSYQVATCCDQWLRSCHTARPVFFRALYLARHHRHMQQTKTIKAGKFNKFNKNGRERPERLQLCLVVFLASTTRMTWRVWERQMSPPSDTIPKVDRFLAFSQARSALLAQQTRRSAVTIDNHQFLKRLNISQYFLLRRSKVLRCLEFKTPRIGTLLHRFELERIEHLLIQLACCNRSTWWPEGSHPARQSSKQRAKGGLWSFQSCGEHCGNKQLWDVLLVRFYWLVCAGLFDVSWIDRSLCIIVRVREYSLAHSLHLYT